MNSYKEIVINNLYDDWEDFIKLMGGSYDLIKITKSLITDPREILARFFIQIESDGMTLIKDKVKFALDKMSRNDLIEMIINEDLKEIAEGSYRDYRSQENEVEGQQAVLDLFSSDKDKIIRELTELIKKKIYLYSLEINQLRIELDNSVIKCKTLLKKNQIIEKKLSDSNYMSQDLDRMTNENIQLKDELEKLKNKLSPLELQNAKLERGINLVNKRIFETVKDNITLKAENEDLMNKLEIGKLSIATGGVDNSSMSFERVDIPYRSISSRDGEEHDEWKNK